MSQSNPERRFSASLIASFSGGGLNIVRHVTIEDGKLGHSGDHASVAVKDQHPDKKCCGIPLNRRFRMVIYFIAYFWAGVAYSLPAPFYPQVASKKGVSVTEIGFVFSVYQIMIFITCPFFGSHLRTIGPKFAFSSGIAVAGACTILFGTLYMCPPGSTFFVLSILVRSVSAIGFASFYTAIMAAASVEYPDNVATAMSIIEVAFGVGMMVGPTIGGVLYTASGFGLPFYALGGVVLLAGMFTNAIMPELNLEHQSNTSGSVLSLFRSPMVIIAAVSTMAGSAGISFMEPTLAKHLEPFGLSIISISLFFIISPCAYTLSSPFLGYLSDSKGIYRELMVIGQFLFGIGFFFIGPSHLLPFLPNQLWTVTVGLFLAGFTFGCTISPNFKCMLQGAIEVGFDENISTYGQVAGIAGSSFSFGAFVGPMAGGVLVQQLGDRTGFTVIGLCNIAVSITAFIIFAIRRFRSDGNAKTTNHTCDEKTSLFTH